MPNRSRLVRFRPVELERFLQAVDRNLAAPAEIVIVGGGAAALGYGVDTGTRDLDTFNSTTGAVDVAAEQARRETGLDIPLGQAGVADLPYKYEQRLKRVMPQLLTLTIRVPERHDLTLSKVVRGSEHDMMQIEALHQIDPLDRDVLMERFLSEMSQTIGNPTMIALGFLECIERLFGELSRVRAEKVLRRVGRLD